jgi:hypothetical protein
MANELFISYAREDSELIHWIESRLRDKGIDPWIDAEDIRPAVPWRGEMLFGAQVCRDFLFLISPDSASSRPCADELKCALRHNKRIIPALARLTNTDIHPVLKEFHWLRFDLDREKAIAQLIKIVESPEGIIEANRPSATVAVYYPDGTCKDFPLVRNCYWVGRRPQPDDRVAGAILLPDPNPKAPITSRFHCELKVVDGKWFAINHSENDIAIYPRSASGLLRHGSKIFIGHCYLVYKELQIEIVRDDEEHPTYPSSST